MLKDYSTKSIILCVCKPKIDSFSVSRALRAQLSIRAQELMRTNQICGFPIEHS